MASTTPAATVTALLALTTPFVQQPSCANIWELTTVSTLSYGSSTTYAVLVSNSADPHFASCQPSGWANIATKSRFSFSPAVCPSGWTYYQMAATIAPTSPYTTYSAAYCCAGGYKLRADLTTGFPVASIDMPCYRSIAPSATTLLVTESVTGGTGSTTRSFTGGVQAHEAWHVSWAASDTRTLSPSLPDLTSSMLVPSWVPGQVIPPGAYDRTHQNDEPALSGLAGSLLLFLEIGIPLIVVALILSCGWCFWARRRSKRRKLAKQQQGGGPNVVTGK